MEQIYKLEGIPTVAKELLKQLEHRILLFDAPMGAGKTTLIQEMIKQLGGEELSQSPTFSLVNEHSLPNGQKVYHFDLYRLNSPEEAWDIGIEEYLYSGDWCFVEWPSIIEEFIPEEHHTISIEIMDEFSRKLIFN